MVKKNMKLLLRKSLSKSRIPSRGGSHAAGSRAWEPALLQNRRLLSLNIIWCALLALALTGCQTIARITPTPTKTPKPPATATATRSPTDTPMPTSTATSTPVPTSTTSPTDTPLPTDTPVPAPTDTPVPANTPPPAPTPTPVEPPTDTPVPAPSVDFKVITQRMFTIKENQGCQGLHDIFMTVVDINGVPLDGIIVRVDDPAGGQIELATGEKGPGKAEYPMFNGVYVVRVLRDGSRDCTSEVTRWLDSLRPTVEDLWNCGYCEHDERTYEECAELREVGQGVLCAGHYSYEVVFQRQW